MNGGHAIALGMEQHIKSVNVSNLCEPVSRGGYCPGSFIIFAIVRSSP